MQHARACGSLFSRTFKHILADKHATTACFYNAYLYNEAHVAGLVLARTHNCTRTPQMALCIPSGDPALATVVHVHEDDMSYVFQEVFGYGVPYTHSMQTVHGHTCCVFAARQTPGSAPAVIVAKVLDDGTIKPLSRAVAGRLLAAVAGREAGGICTRVA